MKTSEEKMQGTLKTMVITDWLNAANTIETDKLLCNKLEKKSAAKEENVMTEEGREEILRNRPATIESESSEKGM